MDEFLLVFRWPIIITAAITFTIFILAALLHSKGRRVTEAFTNHHNFMCPQCRYTVKLPAEGHSIACGTCNRPLVKVRD